MYMYGTGLSFQIYDRDQGHYAKERPQKVLLGVTRALEPNLLGRVEEMERAHCIFQGVTQG